MKRQIRYLGAMVATALLVLSNGTAARADVSYQGQFSEGLGGATYFKNWHDPAFGGTSYSTRADDASWWQTTWDAPNYGVLPRIGKSTEFDPAWGTTVDSTAASLPASFSFSYGDSGKPTSGTVWVGMYGWLDDGTAGWPYSTEFYVVQDWSGTPPSTEAGMEAKGSYTLDGAVYDVYHSVHPLGHQQWFSVRQTPVTSGTVDVKQHFNTWRSLGMADGTVAELSWSAEIMGGSQGTVRYDQWSVPDLKPAA